MLTWDMDRIKIVQLHHVLARAELIVRKYNLSRTSVDPSAALGAGQLENVIARTAATLLWTGVHDFY